jgi:hypothetical protein
MYKLKSNGSSAGSIMVETEDEETVLYRLLSDWNDIGCSASSATMPEQKQQKIFVSNIKHNSKKSHVDGTH